MDKKKVHNYIFTKQKVKNKDLLLYQSDIVFLKMSLINNRLRYVNIVQWC